MTKYAKEGKRMRESQIQKACLDLLESLHMAGLPVFATRTNSGKVMSATGTWINLCRSGWPDVTALIAGEFVGLEFKNGKHGVQSKEQKKVQEAIEKSGGLYLMVDTIEVLRSFLCSRGLL